jgi:hypothetical protein
MRAQSSFSDLLRRRRPAEAQARAHQARPDLELRFQRDGVVYLPGLFDSVFIRQIGAAADRVYAEREEKARRLLVKKGVLVRDELRSIAVANMRLGGAPLMPRLLHDVIVGLAAGYLGKAPAPHSDSYVRAQLPAPSIAHLPFHQDQTIVGAKLVNVWIPLSDCGDDAPGLEVVVGSGGELVRPANPEAGGIVERARLDEKAVLASYPADAIIHPVFSVGDAIIFTGDTIHRTYIAPGMTRSRASIDMRLV